MRNLYSQYKRALQVTSSAAYRFYIDDGFSAASALAYSTLFAVVPLSVIVFLMFNLFQIDQLEVSELLHSAIERFLMPIIQVDAEQVTELQNTLFAFLQQFIAGTGQAFNTLSIALFVFTGIALFNTMESALNSIWRVTSDRSIIVKITNFWAVITLTPILIAVSIYWTTKVQLIRAMNPALAQGIGYLLNFTVPIVATWIALTLLYYRLPAAQVRFRDAAYGAIVSAILFELAKFGFAYYVTQSLSYTKLYGVLATIFLFLLWLYIVWMIVLFGAQICYQSGSLKILTGLKKYSTELGGVGLLLGLQLLYFIARSFVKGEQPPGEGDLAIATGADPVLVRTCLQALEKGGHISKCKEEQPYWVLLRDPEKTSLKAVADTFIQKDHHLPLGNLPEEDNTDLLFLEVLSKTALRVGPDKSWADWNLSDLLVNGVE